MTRINLAPPGPPRRKTTYAAFIGGRLWFSGRAFQGVKNTVVLLDPVIQARATFPRGAR